MDNTESSKTCETYEVCGCEDEQKITIKYTGNIVIKQGDEINDILMDRFDLSDDVVCEIYKCRITTEYLMHNNQLPVIYARVIYEKPLKRILLFKICLYFTIDDKVCNNIKNMDQLLTDKLDGIFFEEIEMSCSVQTINNDIKKYPGDEFIYKKLSSFISSDEMQEMISSLIADINYKLQQQYQGELEYFRKPTNIISLKDYKFE